jgi:hypothetical protein
VVLLALTDRSLLSHASNVAETSENADAESDCDLAAAGLASVADVPRGLHRLVSFPFVQLSSTRKMADVCAQDVGRFRLLHSISYSNGDRAGLRG